MNTLIAVSVVVSVVALVVVAVYLVLALRQIRRTARQAEELLALLNQDVRKIDRISDVVSSFFASFSRAPFVVKILGGLLSGITGFLVSKFRRQKSAQGSEK